MKRSEKKVENLVGLATIFDLVVGFIAILVAMVAFFSGDYSAAGISLIASALGFGLISIALLKR